MYTIANSFVRKPRTAMDFFLLYAPLSRDNDLLFQSCEKNIYTVYYKNISLSHDNSFQPTRAATNSFHKSANR